MAAETSCTYCLGDVENGDEWRVPGEPVEGSLWGNGDPMCHCGHTLGEYHSFHVLFCREPDCRCYSFHRSGENYDDIHDRWH